MNKTFDFNKLVSDMIYHNYLKHFTLFIGNFGYIFNNCKFVLWQLISFVVYLFYCKQIKRVPINLV